MRKPKCMRAFAAARPDARIVQRTVARLPYLFDFVGTADPIKEIEADLAREESLTSSDNGRG